MRLPVQVTRRAFIKAGLVLSGYLALPSVVRAGKRHKQQMSSCYGEGVYGKGPYSSL